jgi:hypothetical protein
MALYGYVVVASMWSRVSGGKIVFVDGPGLAVEPVGASVECSTPAESTYRPGDE